MKRSHLPLLIVSGLLVLLLLGGGLVQVGAAEGSYRQAVLFAEVLSLVMENYVDPLEADRLLAGAYEGMLSGLDPNGAYLSPEEVREWKEAAQTARRAGPGFSVLKSGASLQVVDVQAGSPAAEAGIAVGDQISTVDGRPVRDLSLAQSRNLLSGAPGSTKVIQLLHPEDGFRRERFELILAESRGRAFAVDDAGPVPVLRIMDLERVDVDALVEALNELDSQGATNLLIDLRNLASGTPRDVVNIAAAFSGQAKLQLRDRSGRLLEAVGGQRQATSWQGRTDALVNGATAGGAEALAFLLRRDGATAIFGETTFGLGAEPQLYELEDGAALLVSAALWVDEDGKSWNESGIDPDQEVRGEGDDYAMVRQDQLKRVIALIQEQRAPAEAPQAA